VNIFNIFVIDQGHLISFKHTILSFTANVDRSIFFFIKVFCNDKSTFIVNVKS